MDDACAGLGTVDEEDAVVLEDCVCLSLSLAPSIWRTVSAEGVRAGLSDLSPGDGLLRVSVTLTDEAALDSSVWVAAALRDDLPFALALASEVEDVEMLSLCAGLKRRERRGWLNRCRGRECLCIARGRRAASGAACLARHAVAFVPT